MFGATQVDALFKIDRTIARRAESRVPRRDTFHAGRRITMAVGASTVGGAGLQLPKRLAIEHPQRCWVDRIVILHGLGIAAKIGVAGAALVKRDVAAAGRFDGYKQRERERAEYRNKRIWLPPAHSTVIVAVAVSVKPLSPVHLKSSVPL